MIILDLASIGGTVIMVSGGQNLSKPCTKFCSGKGTLVSIGFGGGEAIVVDAPEFKTALELAGRDFRVLMERNPSRSGAVHNPTIM